MSFYAIIKKMKHQLPIILTSFLILLIIGFLLVWNFLPEATFLSLIFRQPKISAVSDVPGYSLKLALPENLERYLKGFGFWEEEGIFLESEDRKVTVKRLVVHLTDKEQPFSKVTNPKTGKVITSTGEMFDEGTYHLFIFIPSATLQNAPRENLLEAFDGYVLRAAFTVSNWDPELSLSENQTKIRNSIGVVNTILALLGKTRIFAIERV